MKKEVLECSLCMRDVTSSFLTLVITLLIILSYTVCMLLALHTIVVVVE